MSIKVCLLLRRKKTLMQLKVQRLQSTLCTPAIPAQSARLCSEEVNQTPLNALSPSLSV